MDLKVGDVVMLKSGGPSMTVDQVDGDHVWCCWFDVVAAQYSPWIQGCGGTWLQPSSTPNVWGETPQRERFVGACLNKVA